MTFLTFSESQARIKQSIIKIKAPLIDFSTGIINFQVKPPLLTVLNPFIAFQAIFAIFLSRL